ncbi:hypothetical protein VNO77_44182 [Canavalia gladiata]|uniref:Uncharacterized protein n=1 Tax=Canavalia gladiata TaxID=3824 RepID=A0AAN9JY27_CANGL
MVDLGNKLSTGVIVFYYVPSYVSIASLIDNTRTMFNVTRSLLENYNNLCFINGILPAKNNDCNNGIFYAIICSVNDSCNLDSVLTGGGK